MFAFRTQPPAEKPEERVEPICRSCQFAQNLYQPIQPFDVCYFMRKNNAETVISPGGHIMWKQDAGMDNAPGSKDCASVLKQPEASLDAEPAADFVNSSVAP